MAAMQGADERWTEIRQIWKDNAWLLVVVGFVMGLLFQPFLQRLASNAGDFLQNLVPEAIGIGFTVFIIDRLNRRRDEQREVRQLQEQLIRDAGSTSNEIAINAVHQLRKHDWLDSGRSLLTGTDMRGANLGEANLFRADLSNSQIRYANFSRANLKRSNLRRCRMRCSDFSGASLDFANLSEANLFSANLKGANLTGANLRGTNLEMAQFDAETILPDGSRWTPDSDLTQFGAVFIPSDLPCIDLPPKTRR